MLLAARMPTDRDNDEERSARVERLFREHRERTAGEPTRTKSSGERPRKVTLLKATLKNTRRNRLAKERHG